MLHLYGGHIFFSYFEFFSLPLVTAQGILENCFIHHISIAYCLRRPLMSLVVFEKVPSFIIFPICPKIQQFNTVLGISLDANYSKQFRLCFGQNSIIKIERHTWELVNQPKSLKALTSKCVFRVKINLNGSIERNKIRMVIKDYSRKPSVDYDKLFSPVVCLSTVRSAIAVAARENANLIQFDVSTAFLNRIVKDSI